MPSRTSRFLEGQFGLREGAAWPAVRSPGTKSLQRTLAFLNACGETSAISELRNQLAMPAGMAWIWWSVRTSFANPAKVKRRLGNIRRMTADMEHYRAFTAIRARQTRRASTHCHATRPGIPKINSRTRAIKESAKAASPGMPSRLPITT
jgi:hypothetical protein